MLFTNNELEIKQVSSAYIMSVLLKRVGIFGIPEGQQIDAVEVNENLLAPCLHQEEHQVSNLNRIDGGTRQKSLLRWSS